jgi:tetratricopeptide (TPR) repeat protein
LSEQYTADSRRRHDQIGQLLAGQDFAGAEKSCRELLSQFPRDAHGYFLLANIAAEQLQLRQALEYLSTAIKLERNRADYFALMARCLTQLNAPKAALDAAGRSAALQPKDALTHDTLGWVYTRCAAHALATKHFQQAVALQPDNAQFQFNLAAALKFNGELTGAEAAYDRAVALKPDFYQAHWARANLRRQTPENNHIQKLKSLLQAADLPVNAELYLRHALAKELEDLGDYAGAFDNWCRGNDRKKRELDYSAAEDEALFAALKTSFSHELCREKPAAEQSAEPIFIVGMPRTGTTLVERIISSHSAVYAAGELQNLGLVLKQAGGSQSTRILDPEVVSRGLQVDPAKLGQAYLHSTRPATGKTAHFTDKTPLNFLLIGFIARALPNAKIICVRRHPLDTCLSNFRQLFATDFSYYNYAYDLEDTARYYLQFDALMQHWDEVLPQRVLRLDYEELVASQEAQSRRLIEHCGLDWEPACLEFQHNAAPVATASASQVREPLYQGAAGRWRRYAEQLEPARQVLQAGGVSIE